jgi:hypothetical protein
VIVVVGSPTGRRTEKGIVAAGIAATVARVAASAGAKVQLVGKVGEGAAGDAVLLSLAEAGVGHVAALRDASTPTHVRLAEPDSESAVDPTREEEPQPEQRTLAPAPTGPPTWSTLDSGDLELALRYLPDYRVVLVAVALDVAALGTVVAAARWAGAQLIVIVPAGSSAPGLPDDATVLESPDLDPDGTFAAVVGAYAAALDRGASPAEAFASASVESGWSAVD